MGRTELRGINKYYDKSHMLKDISPVAGNEGSMALLGPSGRGKATALHAVVGLEKPQKGYMHTGDKEIVNAPEKFYEEPGKRHLNLVFQSYALWPRITVFDNMAFGPKVAKMSKEEIQKRAENTLGRTGIETSIGRCPSELSGGWQQYVAIARVVVSEPEMLLLNEPLSNLGTKLRIEIRSEVKRLYQELGTIIIYVTHNQTEALTMSTEIAIFFEGVLGQVASPMGLYQSPASLRVADLIGNPKVNFLPGKARVSGDAMTTESVSGAVTFDKKFFTGEAPGDGSFKAMAGVGPELTEILDGPVGGSTEVEVYPATPAGSETVIYLETGEERILFKQNGLKRYSPDRKVWLWINPGKMSVFSKDSGKLAKLAVMDARKDG